VLVVFQLGQPRIFFSMARDGLLPGWAARVHPRYRTPHVTTWISGIAVAVFAAVANINEVVELTNIGTLFAFVLVCVGVTVLRLREPERQRAFRVPFGPWLVPLLGAASCVFLMIYLPPASWWRFIGWLVLGLAVYFSYGHGHSRVGRESGRPAGAGPAERTAALGFLLAALGLFALPHDANPLELVSAAAAAAAPGHARALVGLGLVGLGLAALAVALLLSRNAGDRRG
jgi:APA family basic amino acid/polyamine antiporter